jgi:hypothetical protein
MDSERLLHTCSDDWRRGLLQAGASEVAPEAVTAQVLEALGPALGGAAASTSAAVLAGLRPQLGPESIGLLARRAPSEGWGAAKLATLLVAAVAAGGIAYWWGTRHRQQPASAASALAEQAHVAPAPDDQPLTVGDPAPPSSAAPSVSPSLSPLVRVPRAKRAGSVGDGLSRELRLLSEVRARVRSGDAAAALALLERYERAFPRGELRQEAEELERRARELATRAR